MATSSCSTLQRFLSQEFSCIDRDLAGLECMCMLTADRVVFCLSQVVLLDCVVAPRGSDEGIWQDNHG